MEKVPVQRIYSTNKQEIKDLFDRQATDPNETLECFFSNSEVVGFKILVNGKEVYYGDRYHDGADDDIVLGSAISVLNALGVPYEFSQSAVIEGVGLIECDFSHEEAEFNQLGTALKNL